MRLDRDHDCSGTARPLVGSKIGAAGEKSPSRCAAVGIRHELVLRVVVSHPLIEDEEDGPVPDQVRNADGAAEVRQVLECGRTRAWACPGRCNEKVRASRAELSTIKPRLPLYRLPGPRRLLPKAAACAKGELAPLFTVPLMSRPSEARWFRSLALWFANGLLAGTASAAADCAAAGGRGVGIRVHGGALETVLRIRGRSSRGCLLASLRFLLDWPRPLRESRWRRYRNPRGLGGGGGPAEVLISSSGSSFKSHSGAPAPAAIVTSCLMGAKQSISTWKFQTPSGRSANV